MVQMCPICGNTIAFSPKYLDARCKFCKRELKVVEDFVGKKKKKRIFKLEEKE